MSSRGRRFRNGLVVAEVALAVVVAAGAGLMLRTFSGLQAFAPGFDADRILTLRTSLRGDEFATPAARRAHFDELKRRLEAVPGIASASAASAEPPTPAFGVFGGVRLAIPGFPDDSAAPLSAVATTVMPDFFETLGIPVLSGRGINGDDLPTSRSVAVINRAMADRYFPGVSPLERSFAVYGPKKESISIVGVVDNVITAGNDPAPRPVFYVPYAQNPVPVMTVVMRVPQGDPLALAREAERVAWSLSRSTNVYFVRTVERRMDELNWQPRFGALLLGGFAGLALLLGAVGIYAVISYTVAQRQSEIGLRIALGATGSQVLAMVLAGGLRLTLMGVVSGLIASLGVTRVFNGFLYGVSSHDPLTLGSVSALLVVVAAGACFVPALRASQVNPSLALHD